MDHVAEMPAVVTAALVSDGATVQRDQEIALLESMKMEIPVLAACSGRVTLLAPVGAQVRRGELIAVVSP